MAVDFTQLTEVSAAAGEGPANGATAPTSADRAKANASDPSVKPPGTPPATSAEPAKDEKKEDTKDSVAARFAAITKKERGLVLKQQEFTSKQEAFKAEQEAFKAEQEAFKAQRAEYDRWIEYKKNAKADPLGVLAAVGLTYEDVTNATLNDGKPTADLIARNTAEQLAGFKKELEEQNLKRLEEEKQRVAEVNAAAIKKFETDTTEWVTAQGEAYELINTRNAQGVVVEFIKANFEKTGKLLTAKEAADIVEQQLEEEAQRLLATKKLQAKVTAQTSKEPPKRTDQAQRRPTLSNDMTATSAAAASQTGDRYARAMAILRGNG